MKEDLVQSNIKELEMVFSLHGEERAGDRGIPKEVRVDFIHAIGNIYGGSILLNSPYKGEKPEDVPEEIYSILCISDGIMETMPHPVTGEGLAVGWIMYPCEMVCKESSFYREEYGVEGVVFATDGAGDPYILYSLTIRFSFPHSACCLIMRHALCGNWKILTLVSIKPDGSIRCFDPTCGDETEEAGSLEKFFRLRER